MLDPIFIVGLHRTGSTLWHNLISMEPKVCRLTDMRLLSYWWQRDVAYFIRKEVGDLRRDDNVIGMCRKMLAREAPPPRGLEGAFWRFEGFEQVGEQGFVDEFTERCLRGERSLGGVSRAIIDALTEASGREQACVKFPVAMPYVGQLLNWYPKARIIHITRDPRALAMSRRNDPSGTARKAERVGVLGEGVRRIAMGLVVQQFAQSSRVHQRYNSLENYALFRYEDLLAEPEATLRKLFSFIGYRFNPDVLSPEKSVHAHQPSSLTGRRTMGFDPAAADRWRSVMSKSDRWVISKVAQRSMRRLGYT